MKTIFTLLFFLVFIKITFSQDLPNWMTEQESVLWQNYKHPVNPLFSDPPPSPVRGLAEWEELQGIIITWTSFPFILRQIVDYAQEEGKVYIICSDSNSVKTYLQTGGVPLYNLEFLITPYNTIWCRDYGPWTAYTDDIDTLNIIDWIYNRPRPKDDTISVTFANYIHAPIYQTTTPPYDLIHTGGNLMVDGHGTAFSSKLILNENPGKTEALIDEIMNKFLGTDRYIKMNTLPYDVIHHIDMHIKLLDEETLLVGQYPPGVADGPQIEANLQYVLNNFQTCFGRPYKVVRIPMPPAANGQYPPSGDYRTYTNSMIINKTVMIPTYEYQYDTTAFRIYREAMPGYNVVGIDCNSIIPSLGAIHCIVKEVGVSEPVWISHAKLDSIVYDEDSIAVNAVIKTISGVSNTSVFWTADTSLGFNYVPMQFVSGDTAVGYIPAQTDSTEIYYYISASSNSGRTVSKPLVAPDGFYKFMVENSVTNQTEIFPPEEFYLSQNYPNPFNHSTKIEFRIADGGFVNLKVYDVLGNEVATLVNEVKPEGSYEVKFNAGRLSSGIYIYQLIAKNYIFSRKMVLLK
ncbi:MAG: agmatine deiminase family protein [Ignavibacteriaceae bacterium]|nr:agmatine deiminase family protein [Ignavibacteriaceae bacterium]MCW9098631.1 agmatine deiminase family protein [Ignavibacteriaceae bacterium]